VFDTAEKGNRNFGHAGPNQLVDEQDRSAVIAYLYTLR
jgi:hypothetical protein